jgi:hypothetical protein
MLSAGILLEPTWIVLPNVMGVIAHTAQPVSHARASPS